MNAKVGTGSCVTRKFYRVSDFDLLQNPKRPKRPTWVKSYTRDLDRPDYRNLSLTVRGFFCDFIKLAASMSNRVPYDARLIANRLGIRPQDVGKAVAKLTTVGYLTEFEEDLKTSKIRDLEHLTDAIVIPMETTSTSKSLSTSESAERSCVLRTNGIEGIVTDQVCPQCDGEGCAWCRQF